MASSGIKGWVVLVMRNGNEFNFKATDKILSIQILFMCHDVCRTKWSVLKWTALYSFITCWMQWSMILSVIWQCSAVQWSAMQYVKYSAVQCSARWTNASGNPQGHGNIWEYLGISENIWEYLGISGNSWNALEIQGWYRHKTSPQYGTPAVYQ